MTVAARSYRFTRDQFERMIDAGLFDGERLELLDGEIVPVSPSNPPHADIVDRLTRAFVQVFGDDLRVRVQHPLDLAPTWRPEPDLAIVQERSYFERHPTPDDVVLLVEVADATLRSDLERKLPAYARAGVPEVWIVDVEGERIVAHTEPLAELGQYGRVRPVAFGTELAPGFAVGAARVWL